MSSGGRHEDNFTATMNTRLATSQLGKHFLEIKCCPQLHNDSFRYTLTKNSYVAIILLTRLHHVPEN